MVSTRDKLYRWGKRQIKKTAARDGGAREVEDRKRGKDGAAGAGKLEAGDFSGDNTAPVQVETVGPETQTIRRMPTKWERRIRNARKGIKAAGVFLSRLVYTVWEMRPWREKTKQELEDEAEKKRREKMRRTLRREARLYAKRASNAYARMGLVYEPPLHKRSFLNGTKKVKFSHAVAERNAIWLKVDTVRLPTGVDILKVVNDEATLTNVSASLRHHVEGRYDVERGAWLCIERGRGVRGIPQKITYEKMMDLIPTNADGFTIPLGETVNTKRIYRDLKVFPHMLIGGATGQGKTTYLNVILAALMQRNSPDDLRLVLVDLKGGVEFEYYRGLPHLWKIKDVAPEGIVWRNEGVVPLLEKLIEEGERRLAIFRKAGVSNIDDFNRQKRIKRMRRVVVVFDEYARVALNPGGSEADSLLAQITAMYRAVGFHVILATQTPKKEVISTLIKTNFPARLAFGVPDNTASMVIIDNTKAKGLGPQGRAIFQFGITQVEVQVPLLENADLLRIIKNTKDDGGEVEKRLSMLDIFRYSVKHLRGSLSSRKLHDQFQTQISYNDLVDRLQAIDGQVVDVDGAEYVVRPSNGGAIPRRLVPYGEIPQEDDGGNGRVNPPPGPAAG